MDVVDAEQRLFSITQVDFARGNKDSVTKYVTGGTWCSANQDLSPSLRGGVAVIIDDKLQWWKDHTLHPSPVRPGGLGAIIKVGMPSCGPLQEPANTEVFAAAATGLQVGKDMHRTQAGCRRLLRTVFVGGCCHWNCRL